MTQGSLFDGYGGLRRGLEDAGFQTRWALDILNGHDITTESPDDYERVDLISGGPVCRHTSAAANFQKHRTNESLWPYMLRYLPALAPKWVVVEQPASVERKVILGWVEDMERCGYGVAGRIIDSKHWVPKQRARWFLVGRMGADGMALWNSLYPHGVGLEGTDVQGSQSLRFQGNCPDCLRDGIFARLSSRRVACMGAGES